MHGSLYSDQIFYTGGTEVNNVVFNYIVSRDVSGFLFAVQLGCQWWPCSDTKQHFTLCVFWYVWHAWVNHHCVLVKVILVLFFLSLVHNWSQRQTRGLGPISHYGIQTACIMLMRLYYTSRVKIPMCINIVMVCYSSAHLKLYKKCKCWFIAV